MRRYETMVIADPDLSDEKRDAFFERMKDIISKQGGFLVEFDDWGTRNLAYDIKKKTRGHYIRLDYCGMGEVVNELERFFRIDDRAMKYMTVLLEKDADEEEIKAQIAKAGEEDAKAAVPEENPGPAGTEDELAGETADKESKSDTGEKPEDETPAEQGDDNSTEIKEEEK